MTNEKKIWFKGLSRKLWLPVSIEGWLFTIVTFSLIGLISKVHHISDDVPFVFSQHWPALLELAILILACYVVSKGHVDKRY